MVKWAGFHRGTPAFSMGVQHITCGSMRKWDRLYSNTFSICNITYISCLPVPFEQHQKSIKPIKDPKMTLQDTRWWHYIINSSKHIFTQTQEYAVVAFEVLLSLLLSLIVIFKVALRMSVLSPLPRQLCRHVLYVGGKKRFMHVR